MVVKKILINKSMDSLTISTCQAPNMDFLTIDLAGYISKRLSIPVTAGLNIQSPSAP